MASSVFWHHWLDMHINKCTHFEAKGLFGQREHCVKLTGMKDETAALFQLLMAVLIDLCFHIH